MLTIKIRNLAFVVCLTLLAFNAVQAQSKKAVSGQKNQKSQVKQTKSVKPIGYVVRPMTGEDLLLLIHKVARDWGIEPKLFENLIRKESRGAVCVNSIKGARGITQIMPATGRRLGLRVDAEVDERCDLMKALNAGAKYFRFQMDTFKDVRLALAGYNAGEGAVMQYGYLIPPFKETIQYVELICAWTYGRTGMALEKAYNYNHALKYVSQVYQGNKYKAPSFALPQSPVPQVAFARNDFTPNGQTNSVNPESETSEIKTEITEKTDKPTPRKIVRVGDLEPRLATGSLFFKEN